MRSARLFVTTLAVLTSCVALALAGPTALASEDASAPGASVVGSAVPEALLVDLGKHTLRLEDMEARGAFTLSGHIESVNGDGKPEEPQDFVMRSTPLPPAAGRKNDRVTKIIRYVEDGKDKTAENQTKADERRAKRLANPAKAEKHDKENQFRLPFMPGEQGRYVFSVATRDGARPERVQIAFHPKVPATDAYKGTAWVDENTREILSMGFSFSKNPMFVDEVAITIVFGLVTPLGRAPSQLTFDGRGGLLFIHRRYRGTMTISDPAVAF